jgi:hypothetical protein
MLGGVGGDSDLVLGGLKAFELLHGVNNAVNGLQELWLAKSGQFEGWKQNCLRPPVRYVLGGLVPR